MASPTDTPSSRLLHYHFPLSPPSSGTVTAISSPRLSALPPSSPDVLDSLFAPLASFPSHHSPSPPKRQRRGTANLSDSESHITEQFPPRRAYRKPLPPRTNRALTLPPSTSLRSIPSPKLARPISRRSSSSSTSSSTSTPAQSHERVATSGLGRKVAAKLQLFKETTDDSTTRDSLESTQPATLSNQEVAEAQFEFVKRSEWPDRETAALRRERSSTALERIKTRESSYNEEQQQHRSRERNSSVRGSPSLDVHQWRKDVHHRQDIGRGRRRERGDESMRDPLVLQDLPPHHQFFEPSSPPSRTHSLAYPLSPSPSRSPRSRLPSSTSFSSDPATISPVPKGSIPDPALTQSAPATFSLNTLDLEIPPLTLPPAPISPQETFSPWSTDDESTWETASATTSTSTTSAHFTSPSAEEQQPTLVDDTAKEPAFADDRRQGVHPHRSDTTLDLDFDWNGFEDQLPHIPLRPFRNQVGGHSAIYKFTKQAVCKPLVSRENLFYEGVEREAPPLLSFIPRYLGVMLVSYRRVPKGTGSAVASPHLGKDDPHLARPLLPKSASDILKSANVDIPGRKSPSQSRDDAAGRHGSANDTDSDEDEMPEVVLDRNRHIIPEWMLRGGRNRSMSHCPSPNPANRQLKRLQLDRGTASSPDLASTPTPSSVLHSRLSPLAQYPPYVPSELDALTPVNSPNQSARTFPATISARPAAVHRENYLSDEDESSQRPIFRQFASERPSPSAQPLWFGGTGSTMVNTRLKDHVFSTVLRRMKRRAGSRWGDSTRTEDEGEVDSASGASHQDRRSLRKGIHKLMTQADKLREVEAESYDTATGLRRVQSESMMASPGKLEAMARECERSKERMGVVEREREYEYDRQQQQHPQGAEEEGPIRRRSRSRSLDAKPSAGVPFHQPTFVDEGSIPLEPGLPQSDPTVTRQNHFILMEDLTGRLKHPCVMDLKMGTRQYGMDATSVKKKSQRKKCDRTTSRSLGVRVCGMQVWNHVTQTYTTQDKYKGREVKPEDFDSVLASFLHNGARLLAYQIPALLQKLYALARIIYRLKGYRFYGCSLLLIYDGDGEVQEGYRSLALEHPSSRSKRGESFERRQSRSKSQTKSEKSSLRRSHSEDLLVGPIAKRSSEKRKRGEVLVRIVDFAHTTTGRDWVPYPGSHDRNSHHEAYTSSTGYQAEVDPETGLLYARFPPHYPDQPDRGFLSGLKSLTESLERIWNDERLRRVKAARENPTVAPLPPLQTDGKEIFDEIFGGDEEDSGMIST
ncbi:SAICAR synthase-like protein [Pluteus cervinus]|uniref:SAICAR synthase-like protein n=1 Tax=Pluteus cervinus TaxID=181527 RepID=A0ACD3B990_9AGAR|nr:SAICAR synthase-like protein [Pluteus cervinus]